MSTIYERGDGCSQCIDGRVPVIVDGIRIANTICDCKLEDGHMNILEMEAGMELNALVSEKIMGWRVERKYEDYWIIHTGLEDNRIIGSHVRSFNPSESISAAWEVVEKMRETHIYELADFGRKRHHDKQHYCAFHPLDKPRNHDRQVRAKTLPEAIAKAALLAMEGIKDAN